VLSVDLWGEFGPDRIGREIGKIEGRDASPPEDGDQPMLPHLVMPAHHDVRPKDVILRRLHGSLTAAADQGPSDFKDLLMVPGVGARTVRSLAMVAEVIHGAPHRFSDPARFSMSKGGKDSAPFPVPLKVYDETIKVLKYAVVKARLGATEELAAIKRLDKQAQLVERTATGPTFHDYVAEEWRRSPEYGGRTVMDDVREKGLPIPKWATGR
jgi:hypothetical protein